MLTKISKGKEIIQKELLTICAALYPLHHVLVHAQSRYTKLNLQKQVVQDFVNRQRPFPQQGKQHKLWE